MNLIKTIWDSIWQILAPILNFIAIPFKFVINAFFDNLSKLTLHFGEHWNFELFGLTVNMDTVLTTWLAMAIVLIISLIVSMGLNRKPSKFQAFAELIYNALESIPVSQIGKEGKSFTPIIGSLFLFILTANLIGQLPWKLIHLSKGEFASPTNDLNLTAALAILAVICYLIAGMIKKGPIKYLRQFFTPMGLLELLELVTRPLSLALRLFANILAGEIVIMVAIGIAAIAIPFPFMLFEIFVAFIQAFIFAVLTASYIAGAVSEEH